MSLPYSTTVSTATVVSPEKEVGDALTAGGPVFAAATGCSGYLAASSRVFVFDLLPWGAAPSACSILSAVSVLPVFPDFHRMHTQYAQNFAGQHTHHKRRPP